MGGLLGWGSVGLEVGFRLAERPFQFFFSSLGRYLFRLFQKRFGPMEVTVFIYAEGTNRNRALYFF